MKPRIHIEMTFQKPLLHLHSVQILLCEFKAKRWYTLIKRFRFHAICLTLDLSSIKGSLKIRWSLIDIHNAEEAQSDFHWRLPSTRRREKWILIAKMKRPLMNAAAPARGADRPRFNSLRKIFNKRRWDLRGSSTNSGSQWRRKIAFIRKNRFVDDRTSGKLLGKILGAK